MNQYRSTIQYLLLLLLLFVPSVSGEVWMTTPMTVDGYNPERAKILEELVYQSLREKGIMIISSTKQAISRISRKKMIHLNSAEFGITSKIIQVDTSIQVSIEKWGPLGNCLFIRNYPIRSGDNIPAVIGIISTSLISESGNTYQLNQFKSELSTDSLKSDE